MYQTQRQKEMQEKMEQEKLIKAQEVAVVEWQQWFSERDTQELDNISFNIKTFSTKKDWATDFKTHPHGGRKANDQEVAKYLSAYKDQLQEWGLTPLHCRNLLVTYADWGLPE